MSLRNKELLVRYLFFNELAVVIGGAFCKVFIHQSLTRMDFGQTSSRNGVLLVKYLLIKYLDRFVYSLST